MRFYLTYTIAKLVNWTSILFGFGSGFTWPGNIVLKLYPKVLTDPKIRFDKGVVFISGTNGKTTTSKLTSHVLEASGYSVVSNATGGNILNGIVSTVLLNFKPAKEHIADFGVFEVDEFTLPILLEQWEPDILVLLNLSRDQLDRYGEVDIIFEKWHKAIAKLSDASLVVYENQPQFKKLEKDFDGDVFMFNDDSTYLEHTSLRGVFNAKNVNAVVGVGKFFELENVPIIKGLESFKSAYGRGETILHEGKPYTLYLAKNPASFNHNLYLLDEFSYDNAGLLIILNDKIPDGRDVSWIYDINSEKMFEFISEFKNIYISGTRSLDMAVRLDYAGIELSEKNIESNLKKCVDLVAANSDVESIIALPNYSSMLELRKILTGRAIL